MSQFFIALWNTCGLFEIVVYALLCGLGAWMLYTHFNARRPDCGSRLNRTDEEKKIIERITHFMATCSLIDLALPVTNLYRCTGNGFASKRLDPLTKSNNSKSAGAK